MARPRQHPARAACMVTTGIKVSWHWFCPRRSASGFFLGGPSGWLCSTKWPNSRATVRVAKRGKVHASTILAEETRRMMHDHVLQS